MSLERAERRLLRKERNYEISQRMKNKFSEEYDALEEVFDRSTIFLVFDLMRAGVIGKLGGAISAGKESRVFWGLSPEGRELAIKIYLTADSEFRKGMLQYIIGDPRFTKVRRGTRSLVHLWASKEFKNLERAQEAGVRAPKPIIVRENVLVMEFVGRRGRPAPLLKDVELEDPDGTYRDLLKGVRRLFLKARLVHGDLSQYNVMIWKKRAVIFDLSQSMLREHVMAMDLLRRDIGNLNAYFRRVGAKVLPEEEAIKWVTSVD